MSLRNAYLVQWKGHDTNYHSDRQIIVDSLTNNPTVTIRNLVNNTQYTVRIAAIQTNKPGILRDDSGYQRYTEITATPSN